MHRLPSRHILRVYVLLYFPSENLQFVTIMLASSHNGFRMCVAAPAGETHPVHKGLRLIYSPRT
jgi:hypothetical protein